MVTDLAHIHVKNRIGVMFQGKPSSEGWGCNQNQNKWNIHSESTKKTELTWKTVSAGKKRRDVQQANIQPNFTDDALERRQCIVLAIQEKGEQ